MSAAPAKPEAKLSTLTERVSSGRLAGRPAVPPELCAELGLLDSPERLLDAMDQPRLTKRRLNFSAVERPHTLAIQSLVFVRCACACALACARRSSGPCRGRPGRAVESGPIVRRGPCSHR